MPKPLRTNRKKLRVISLDTETTGLDFHHGARPFLVSFCNEGGLNTWFQWDVNPLTRQPKIVYEDLQEIQDVIDGADILILQNAKFDVHALQSVFLGRLRWDWSKVHDTLIAGHLLASNQPHDLTSMALIYLKVNIQPYEDDLEKAVKEAKKWAKANHPEWRLAKSGLPDMPSAKDATWKYDSWLPRLVDPKSDVLAEYSNADSAVTIKLWQRQMELIKEMELTAIYKESLKVLPSIYAMEDHGVTMSRVRTEELKVQYTESSARLHGVCVNLSDGEIEQLPKNGASNALKSVLFDKFQLKSSKKTPKGNASVDKFVLDEWLVTLPEREKPYQFVKALRGYRKRQTALGYIESYQKFWLPIPGSESPSFLPRDKWGNLTNWMRLYPSVNPTGTDTLRMSSENPNAQQISRQEITEVGEESHSARYMFGPAPGREWWSLDAKNIELRIPAYEAGETAMIDLFERPDDPPYYGSYHLLNASLVYPDIFWPIADRPGEFKDQYSGQKGLYYTWIKGMGFAMQYQCGPETADRAAHKTGAYDLVKTGLPKMAALNTHWVSFADKHGYVETMPDKTIDSERGYPLYCMRTKWGKVKPTVPLSYHVQGTAMWWMRKAMVRCHDFLERYNERKKTEARAYLIMQIHDEMVFDFPKTGPSPQEKILRLNQVVAIRKLMEQGGNDIGVPTPVSVEYHPICWSEGVSL